jgi:hypothetical protein
MRIKIYPADRISLQFIAGRFDASPVVMMLPRGRPAIPMAPVFF